MTFSFIFVQEPAMQGYQSTFPASTTTFHTAMHSPSVPAPTRLATDCVIESRRTWKSLKSTKEYVWPPNIERALIEGLEKYRPTSSANPRALKRFPKRNRWISDHIRRTTGVTRTAKQVGSRLQQLRDSCKDDRIQKLLFRREYSPEAESVESSSGGSSCPSSAVSSPSSTMLTCSESSSSCESGSDTEWLTLADQDQEQKFSQSTLCPRTVVTIEIPILTGAASTYKTGQLPFIDTSSHEIVVFSSQPLIDIVPIIWFTSSTFICIGQHRSSFSVFRGHEHVHSESTGIVLESSSAQAIKSGTGAVELLHLYRSDFIPRFWDNLGKIVDLSQYMIVHHIIRSSPQTCHSEKGTPSLGDVLFTMTYHFRPAPVHTASGVVSLDHVGVVPLTGPSENTCAHPGPPHTTDFPQPTPASTDNAEYSYIPESIVNVDGNQQMDLHFDYRGFQPDTSSCQATDTSNSPDTRNGGASFPENQEFAFVEPCQAVPQDFSSTSNDSRLSTGTTFYSTNDGARIPAVHQIRECDALGLNGRPFAPYPNLPCQEDCPEYYLATDVSRDAYFWGPKVVHDFQYNAEFHNYQLAREDHRGDLSGHIQSGFVEVHGENFNDGSAVPTSFDGQFLLADGHGHDYYAPSQSPTESLCA